VQELVYENEAEVEAAVRHRDFPPSRHQSRGPHQLQDERLVEVAVAGCCFVLVDPLRIVRDSVDIRYQPGWNISKDFECK
jgi:hypothetical protein